MSISLEKLSDDEVQLLVKCPALVTVLIAGADDHIDKSEKNWASKLVHYRTFATDPILNEYYKRVEEHFEDNLAIVLEIWDSSHATEIIAKELETVKPILAKLPPEQSELIKNSWKSLAKKVAEASGGLMGFGSIDAKEAQMIDLPML